MDILSTGDRKNLQKDEFLKKFIFFTKNHLTFPNQAIKLNGKIEKRISEDFMKNIENIAFTWRWQSWL